MKNMTLFDILDDRCTQTGAYFTALYANERPHKWMIADVNMPPSCEDAAIKTVMRHEKDCSRINHAGGIRNSENMYTCR
jgi:hypothetical protein